MGADTAGVTDCEQTPQPTGWSTFIGWHRDESMWKSIYVNTASTLLAALVVYLIGAVSGVFTRQPVPVLCVVFTVVEMGVLVVKLRRSSEPGQLRLTAMAIVFGVVATVATSGWADAQVTQ
jgi:hypothetical protein